MSNSNTPPRCYNRVANEEPAFSPCSTSGNPAQCCDLETMRCATNGLCVIIERFSSDDRYAYNTGGCTDASWGEDTCVDHCRQCEFALDDENIRGPSTRFITSTQLQGQC